MCDCKVKTYKYTACLHRSKTRVLCWKASWRTTNFLCLGQVITPCRPKKEKKERFGLCTKCTHQFLPYHINDPRYVRKYLKWKEDNGYEGKRIDARVVPLEAIFNIGDRQRKFRQQSPMVARAPRQQQYSVNSFDRAAAGALGSDYANSAFSYYSPVREFRTQEPIDLSDLTNRASLGIGHFPTFPGRARAGAKMLDLYRDGSGSSTGIVETLLSPCDEGKLQPLCPLLEPAPKKPSWRSIKEGEDQDQDQDQDGDKASTTYLVVAMPPPLKSSEGLVDHVLPDRAAKIRAIDSAPPASCLARVKTPGGRYTCAPQALCQCDKYGREACLGCFEKARESFKLQANFI